MARKSNAEALLTKAQVEEITSILRFARTSLDIWWFFTNKEFVSKNKALINEYSQFLFFNNEANLCAFVIRICVLFDRDRRTQSMKHVADAVFSDPTQASGPYGEFLDLQNKADPIAAKLLLLRNNAMAHKSKILSFTDVYRQASITPNEMRDLTEYCLGSVNILRKKLAMQEVKFEHDFLTEDLESLCDAIASAETS